MFVFDFETQLFDTLRTTTLTTLALFALRRQLKIFAGRQKIVEFTKREIEEAAEPRAYA